MSSRASSNVSFLDHMSNLGINSALAPMRLTGIVCTIGPASMDPAVLEKMLESGMNIARLNFSHGTHDYHASIIRNLRQAVTNYSKKLGRIHPLAIAIDTKGSEIRTGLLEGGSTAEVKLEKGNPITVTTNEEFARKGTKDLVFVDYKNITEVVKAGDRIFIDDGLISLLCTEPTKDGLKCVVENGGVLGSSKGVNLPGIQKDLPTISEKDRKDLSFGVEQGVDFVFASFTRNAEEVCEIQGMLRGSPIKVVAKIENQEGIDHMDEIIAAADGILIDRGDLGMEISFEKVFLAQKKVIARCMTAGRPIIIATHLLESMVEKPRPTRAESSDVANAVLDGADCIMLSGETAKGAYPVECVAIMTKICREAEAALWQKQVFIDLTSKNHPPLDMATTVAIAAVEASVNAASPAIIVITKTGNSARLISKYRPKCPIIAVTRSEQVARHLHLYRAVIPLHYVGTKPENWMDNVNERVQDGVKFGKSLGFIKSGSVVVVVTGWKQGAGFTNTMNLLSVE